MKRVSRQTLKIFFLGLTVLALAFLWQGENFLDVNDGDACKSAEATVIMAGSPDEDRRRVLEGVEVFQDAGSRCLILPVRHKVVTWRWLVKHYGISTFIPDSRVLIGRHKPADRMSAEEFDWTFAEANKAVQLMVANKVGSAVIVSSRYHMRRVRLAFERTVGNNGITLCYRSVKRRERGMRPWWLDFSRLRRVVKEYAKLLAAVFAYP